MPNSYVSFCLALYHGILTDLVEQGTICRKDLERDYSRLVFLAGCRGITVFTVDLPALGKHFDLCLARGLLTQSNIPLSSGDRSCGANPRLFKGMFLKVFSLNGMLKPDPDIAAVRALRQLCYAAKKLRIQCDASKTYDTVKEYFEIEQELRSPSLIWDEDRIHASEAKLLSIVYGKEEPTPSVLAECGEIPLSARPACNVLDSVQRVADIIAVQLGWFDPLETRFKHGPGAVSDQLRWENKYVFPNWPDKLEGVFPSADFAFANYGAWADNINNRGPVGLLPHEPPSVLIAVPKTQKGPRLIAKEPIAHQWAQQAVLAFLSDRVAQSSIRDAIEFRSQEPSRQLALQSSLHGSHWTIDLSSASDRVSLWLVERLFRRNVTLLEAFHACRTRWLVNNIDKNSPKAVRLRKFSTMGSALTFPVQTIVFTVIAIGCLLSKRDQKVTPRTIERAAKEVQVFGDDTIVPDDCGALVTEVLTYLGLKVNVSKTFGTGRFRESCGMDAFCGTDVTPGYVLSLPVKGKPESLISLVEVARNFASRGYWATADVLKSIGMKNGLQTVGHTRIGSGIFGWPALVDTFHRRRWNNDLQAYEHLALVPVSRQDKAVAQDSTSLLQYFTEAPEPTTMWSAGIGLRPRLHLKQRWVSSLSSSSDVYCSAKSQYDVSKLLASDRC